jgi:pyridoxamine 5'-phosphate oxidase
MADQPDTPGRSAPFRGPSLRGEPAALWRSLIEAFAAATASSRHPLHLLTVATVDAGGGPQLRTVVLRGFDPGRREVVFHTDIRSPKATQIRGDGRVALHWYDPGQRLQIRIPAVARIHHDDPVSRAAWEACQRMSRACYLADVSPGTPLAWFPTAPLAPAPGDERGLQAFAVVRCRFDSLELLALSAAGHERIRLVFAGQELGREILAP